MSPTADIKIAYTNDQLFPITETDAEQLMSAMAEVGKLDGVQVDFIFPAKWGEPGPTAEALADYYAVDQSFRVFARRSAYPSFRGLEKMSHGVVSLLHPAFKAADLLYTRNLPSALATLALTLKPVMYETFRPWPDQQKSLVPLLRWMVSNERLLGVVTHSALAGRSFLDIGMKEEKLLVAYNGYDPERMAPVLSKEEACERLGLPADKPQVSYVGHVTMGKGLGMMLDLAREIPEAIFVIVGSLGRGAVESLAESLVNVRIVPWLPFHDAIPYLYASDILFIPPSWDPLKKVGNTVLPIKTFQYMASGRAIFGPATPDLMELLKDGQNAVLVEPDNLDAAREALTALLADPERYRALGAKALADVADLTWARRALKLRHFIEERLLAAGAR
jgi:glycosyltransferase involved in cell wall biosynthesis